jgi:hypothetical protein
MSSLADRLSRLGWMAVPIAAYLVITLALPMAHGAGARGNFAHHAGTVAAGCAVVVGLALLGGVALDGARAGVRRVLGRGGRA